MHRLPLVVPTVVALALTACQPAPQPDVSKAQVLVELRDYSVKPSVSSVAAGRVTIGIRNLAGMAHDLVVLKTDTDPGRLSIDSASAKAKEEGKVGAVAAIAPGRVALLTVDLTAGRHVLLCNVAGHYQLGMHAPFRVE